MRNDRKTLNIGLIAHVDAGKTTLAEAVMYLGGSIRRLGRVDHGDAFLDTDPNERERGITIFSKQARLEWKSRSITLIDTPGHVDFSGEAERAVSILDVAILVVSGSSGVQAHTTTLWRLLDTYSIPVFVFVNKMDQPGSDRKRLMDDIKKRLSDLAVDMGDADFAEKAALADEDALEEYLSTGELSENTLAALVSQRKLFMCYFGSALKISGIDALLDGVVKYSPDREYPDEFSARVYKIARDGDTRLTYLKVTGGRLCVRDLISGGAEKPWDEKIGGIRFYSGQKFTARDSACAGDVCAVTGLSRTYAGENLGCGQESVKPLLEGVFTYSVIPPKGVDAFQLFQKLLILAEEDPLIQATWDERLREIRVVLMGEVQKEILQKRILDRFGVDALFGSGSILYRETIASPVIGVGHYEPLRHYAEVRILMEPGEPGSGVRIRTACSQDVLEGSWQRLIMTHLGEKRHTGVLTGSPVTDIKFTLLAGRAHLKHTEGGDFRQATYRAVRQGLMSAECVLLEPWYDIRIELARELAGRAVSDISQMGGTATIADISGDEVCVLACAPVARTRFYARDVAVYTRGRGRVSLSLAGYRPSPDQDRIVYEIGYDPERDLANTADSVFCSHGAGYLVSWDKAPDFMHIQPEREYAAEQPASTPKPERTTDDEEAELNRIFERTFGPIKQSLLRPTPKSAPTAKAYQFKDLDPELLIVDGYNIIFAWDELKQAAKDSLDAARQCLMDILCNYKGFRQCEITLVFDAYKVNERVGSEEVYKNIFVVYTKPGETADQYIEKIVFEKGKKRRVRVATSDRAEQFMVLGDGALRVSADEFHAEVKSANVEISAILQKNALMFGRTRSVEAAMRDALVKKDLRTRQDG